MTETNEVASIKINREVVYTVKGLWAHVAIDYTI